LELQGVFALHKSPQGSSSTCSFFLSLKLHDDGNNERKKGEKREMLMMTTIKKCKERIRMGVCRRV
jgi:hypothetical protein